MKEFKNYINEAVFKYGETKYFDVVFNKIKAQVPIEMGAKGELTPIIITYNDELKRIHAEGESNLEANIKGKAVFIDSKTGEGHLWTKIFKGQFSGIKNSTNNAVTFSGGDNTKIGESIQVCGLFMKLDGKDSFNFDGELYKQFTKLMKDKKLNLADGEGIIAKYMYDEQTLNTFSASLYGILYASSLAANEIKTYINYTNVIHDSIDELYAIFKEKGLVDKKIAKENTADCVVYNGTNFMKNLQHKDSKIESSNYNIKVMLDGQIVNEFLQISLKSGGRLGDLSTFTAISNNHKYLIYEGFGDYLKTLTTKIKKTFLTFGKKITSLLGKVLNKIKNLDKNGNDILISLFYRDYEKTNETKQRTPKEKDIFEKYSDINHYKKLENISSKTRKEVINKLEKLGAGVLYNLPELDFPSNPTSSELRFTYYNTVSFLVMDEYLKSISSAGDFQKMEIEMIYGNTLLPLIKVFADYTNPIEFLPIEFNMPNTTLEVPVFAIKTNITKGKYLSFYFYILSTNHTEEPTYLQVQMRTKGDQYVVDGQSYVSYSKMIKGFSPK